MTLLACEVKPSFLRWEAPFVCLLVWMVLVSIPMALGGIGLSSDALNHHIYLGWTAHAPRFDLDFLAASYQSYQFPYLYWPVYQLALSGWSGAWAGAALATLQSLVVPPVWMLSRTCIPGQTVFDLVMRALAVAMAFLTCVVLSLFDSTANDLLAATPLVWALALAMVSQNTRHSVWLTPGRALVLSGLMAGVAVAFKLSNGPLALVLPIMWYWVKDGSAKARLLAALKGCLALVLGYVLIYGYWGAQLWGQFGNPIYPFYDSVFAPIRQLTGWLP